MNPKIALLVKVQIEKLLEACFIQPINYSCWISNIFLVTKLDDHIKICMKFHYLNKESLKDDFPIPNIDMIVDSTMGHSFLSFMDRFSRYNQIFINSQDKYKTTFTKTWGIFC
jgi:hypothetical protein